MNDYMAYATTSYWSLLAAILCPFPCCHVFSTTPRRKGIDHLDTAVIDEDLIGGALVEEADGDQHISSMTTFELAQVQLIAALCTSNNLTVVG